MTLRFISVCSGIEAASVAWEPFGWRAWAFAEIDPFASALLASRFPGVPNLGDMTRYREWPNATVDLLCGGTPCFPAETLIASKRGLLPISDIAVGDMVLTHAGRWRRVLAVGSRQAAETIRVTGQGSSSGVVTTPEHPFYARRKVRKWVGRAAGSWASEMSGPDWVDAKDMGGLFWASPSAWPSSDCPAFEPQGREASPPQMTPALAWVIGRWLGDGWTRINQRRGYAIICCSHGEAGELGRRLSKAGFAFSQGQERTTARFQIGCRAFARWLNENFGSGAAGKTMPTWAFGWAYRRQLLEGYLSADGCRTPNGWRLSTVSRRLALGLVLLAHSLGMSTSRRLVETGRERPTIEGREVNERPFWQVSIYEKARSSVDLDGHRWGLVRKVETNGASEVFNIEVDGDNSYVADGVVVHNCQSFSVAGLRRGLDDPRGNLALVFLGIVDRYRPRWVLWENVPGVLSSNGGRDFGAFLGGLAELGYGFAWRVLDAQYVRVDGFPRAVPQRRQRVFLVGHSSGDVRRPAAVLFDGAGMRGDPAPRRKAGQVSPTLPSRASGGGGLGTDHDLDGGLIAFDPTQIKSPVNRSAPKVGDACHALAAKAHVPAICYDVAPNLTTRTGSGVGNNGMDEMIVAHSLRGEGFDASEDGTGRGVPLIASTLTANANGGGRRREDDSNLALTRSGVRRLTPVECERLMGFPDGWTAIAYRGKPAADSPRYRALGNSWAVNVARWVGMRIAMVEAHLAARGIAA